MAVVDKLDRWRTCITAVATLREDVPFWVTLTPNERRRADRKDEFWFFKGKENDRRRFRCFVRNMTPKLYQPTKKASALADRYAAVARRHTFNRESPAYCLAVARGWVLRHGANHGVVCVD